MKINKRFWVYCCNLLLLLPFIAHAKPYEMKTVTLFDNTLAINLPAEFVEVDKNIIAKKYPLSNKPITVYTNDNADFNFSFKKINRSLTPADIPRIKEIMNNAYQQYKPTVTDLTIDNKQTVLFDFVTPSTGAKIHNLMLFFPLKNETVII